MPPLEIERKFLIERSSVPDEKCSDIIEIRQVYLTRNSADIQRRVRSMGGKSGTSYYYTEKKFISPSVREENEREITHDEFEALLKEADPACTPVIKTRKILIYEGQRFETDCYPFSEKYASIELELEREGQEINFPPYIRIIKEVTGDPAYSNAALAKRGKFPD